MRVIQDMKHLEEKRLEVLEEIKPICEAFAITDYDYEVYTEGQREVLRIYDTRIGCSCNSMRAIKDELIGWIFVNTFVKHRGLGAFKYQTLNYIKRYWIKEEK